MRRTELFSGNGVREYTAGIARSLQEEVGAMSDQDICSCNLQEWEAYLCEKYEIVPVTLYEDAKSQTLENVKVQQYNPMYKHIPYEREYYEVDGYRITVTIPFDGDENLWHLQPNYRILTSYYVENIVAPRREKLGSISLCFEYTKREIEEKGDDLAKYVSGNFENEFKNYRTMIGHVCSEISSFNKGLAEFARKCLLNRKEKAESFSRISRILEIPLNKSETAPCATPVALKRVERKPPRRPEQRETPREYAISDSDYENIINILYSYGTTMEKTARTYIQNNEEELRDHMLAALNTHYENATGETFRKIGKTDINIEFENKAAFIGECKIWHGEKLFSEAVDQLLSYSTWRDLKVSLIVFNKNNQNFRSVLEKVEEWIKENTATLRKKKENLWECDYYRADQGVTIKLTVLVLDLYVDKTQIQDKRY